MSDKLIAKMARAEKANELIREIASCGRKFFFYENGISQYEVDNRGRVWFVDGYRKKRIYLHYQYFSGFSQGGTLRSIVVELFKKYICEGKKINPQYFGPWPDWYCDGDLWGYGGDMQRIRDKAKALEII